MIWDAWFLVLIHGTMLVGLMLELRWQRLGGLYILALALLYGGILAGMGLFAPPPYQFVGLSIAVFYCLPYIVFGLMYLVLSHRLPHMPHQPADNLKREVASV